MRRWLRILVVGVLTVLLSIDSASACRLLRGRCRPRCRVVSYRVVRHAPPCPAPVSAATSSPCGEIVSDLPAQCCVPDDGSAHAVIVETQVVPETAPAVVDKPGPAVPQPVREPIRPLEPIAPASAEKPMPAAPETPPAPVPPAPQPQFKTAREILAEAAEKEKLEKAAISAVQPPPAAAPPTLEPPMAKSGSEPTQPPPAAPEPKPAVETDPKPAAETTPKPAAETTPAKPAATTAPVEPAPAEPAPVPAAQKPAAKPAEANLFDEGDDEPAEKPANAGRGAMKKEQSDDDFEDLFGEPEMKKPAATEKSPPPPRDGGKSPPPDTSEEPKGEDSSEETSAPESKDSVKQDDDPFAGLDSRPEPVRRWIDSTGAYETIGRLVEVHPDRIRILKRNGRYTTVPLDRLSRHDQAYAKTVGTRIARTAPAQPAATDTASR